MPALSERMAVMEALLVRDLLSRFGRRGLGFVWVILEPMLLTCGVLVVWSLMRGTTVHNVAVLPLVVTGYLPLTIWRHMTGSTARLLHNQSNLLYHRQISHFDIVIARLVMEFLAASAALATILFFLLSLDLMEPISDWGLVLAGWVLTGLYFAGNGLAIAGASQYWEKIDKIVQPMNYLMLPISGVFFMVDWLPSWAQQAILWNPPVNCIEMLRAGFFGEAATVHYDAWYATTAALVALLIGTATLAGGRRHIEF